MIQTLTQNKLKN